MLIPPYNHPDIISGQGTMALEFLEQVCRPQYLAGMLCCRLYLPAWGLVPSFSRAVLNRNFEAAVAVVRTIPSCCGSCPVGEVQSATSFDTSSFCVRR